jgi:biotin carboxylase
MTIVVFVAPFLLETTLRFVDVSADLADVRACLVTQDPEDRVPPALRAKLAAQHRVDDALDPSQISAAVRALSQRFGRVDRLLAALEQLQVPLARVREELGIPGMGVEAATNFRDKARMKDVLREAGMPCARHRLAESPEDALDFVRQVGYPVVAKPPAGAGALTTFRVDGPEQLEKVLAVVPPRLGDPLMVEQFVRGEEHSFDSVFIDGALVWCSISDYLPSPLEVLETPWMQWCVLLPRDIDGPRYEGIREAAVGSLEALGMDTGFSHLEWFRRADGSLAISEVAARPPGAQFTTLISYAHDVDMYRAWARLMAFGTFEVPERAYAAGAAYLRGLGRGKVKAMHGLDQAQEELGDLVVEAKLPVPGQPASGSYEGEGYVILRHPDTDVVHRGLLRLVSLLRVELVEDRSTP